MFLLVITVFLIYSFVNRNDHREYSLLELFKRYEKVEKAKYETRRSRGVL